MNHRGRSVLALALAAIVCFTGVMTLSTAEVAAKSNSGKLSAKSVTIAMGGSQKIKLKKGKGKWRIDENGVARISKKTKKYAKVVPVKAGTTTLYCKTGGKTYKCRIKVLNNSIGSAREDVGTWAAVVGSSTDFTVYGSSDMPPDLRATASYDTGKGSVKIGYDTDEEDRPLVDFEVKAKKAGRFTIDVKYSNGMSNTFKLVFINGFRGKTKCKKTNANYKKWRKAVISSMVSQDMTTWEIINALGTLIDSGKYGMKGGATGMQLWYGGNGTCVSGAKMMKDFMDDLGIKSSIHFMGKKGGAKDINGWYIMYASQHKNTWVTLGGETYELNPQPGQMWPIGTVKR